MKNKPKRPRTRSTANRFADAATLRRAIARLAAARHADARRHARQLAAVRREADRRLAAMVHEIATLRHHEARAEALARLLAGRDEEIARLAASLEKATAPAPV